MTLNRSVNLAAHGYQIVRELGRNWEGGRITYLATTGNHQVVLKGSALQQ